MSNKMYWCLDIGHGENTYDNGSKGRKLPNGTDFEEHHFNADVGIRARKLAEFNGFKILFTQEPYANDVALTSRTNKINSEGVYGVISIHANAGVHSANGACSFYWHSSTNGKRLADLWVKNFKEVVQGVGLHGNGQHASQPGSWTNMHMVRETRMVALLTENGFFTHDENDMKYIQSEDYRQKCAEVIVRTMCDYVGIEFKKPQPKSIPQPEPEPEYEDWRVAEGSKAIDELHKAGIISNPESWKGKLLEPADNWLVFLLLKRLYDKK